MNNVIEGTVFYPDRLAEISFGLSVLTMSFMIEHGDGNGKLIESCGTRNRH